MGNIWKIRRIDLDWAAVLWFISMIENWQRRNSKSKIFLASFRIMTYVYYSKREILSMQYFINFPNCANFQLGRKPRNPRERINLFSRKLPCCSDPLYLTCLCRLVLFFHMHFFIYRFVSLNHLSFASLKVMHGLSEVIPTNHSNHSN